MFLARRAGRDIEERPEWSRDPKSGSFFQVGGEEDRLVEHASLGRGFPEPGRDGEVDHDREEFRQIVEDQGRLMGDDGLGFIRAVPAPEREPDQILIFGHGDVVEPIESVLDPFECSGRDVVIEVRIIVTREFRLLCRKIAALFVRQRAKRFRG